MSSHYTTSHIHHKALHFLAQNYDCDDTHWNKTDKKYSETIPLHLDLLIGLCSAEVGVGAPVIAGLHRPAKSSTLPD